MSYNGTGGSVIVWSVSATGIISDGDSSLAVSNTSVLAHGFIEGLPSFRLGSVRSVVVGVGVGRRRLVKKYQKRHRADL